MRVVLVCLCFAVVSVSVAADVKTGQKPLEPSKQALKSPWMFVGAFVDYNRNVFSADFASFPNLPTCNESYRSGSGNALSLGLLAEYVYSPTISIGARVGYADLGGALTNTSLIGYTSQLGSNQQITERVETQYAMDVRLRTLTFEPYISQKLFGRFRVFAGLRTAFALSSTFSESERIVRPDYVFFVPDSTRTRLQRSGDIPNVNAIQLAPTIGVAMEVPLNRNWYLVPEIRYQQALSDISDVNWSVSTIQMGVSLLAPLYTTPPPVIRRDTVFERDTVLVPNVNITQERVFLKDSSGRMEQSSRSEDDQTFIEERTVIVERYVREVPRTAMLSLSLQSFTVTATGERTALQRFIVEENETEENYSLLPHVFFPDGESRLERTSMKLMDGSRVGTFSESTLPQGTLDVYHDLLNIVGYRMKENPSEKITLIGCNSSIGSEKNNIELSRARAESVRTYLQNVWGIAQSRIAIKAQNLPSSPSNISNAEGEAENRRVEIVPDNPEFLKAVAVRNTTVRSTPSQIEIVPVVSSEAGVQRWNAKLVQGERVLREFGGQDSPQTYDWKVSEEPYPKMEKPVSVLYSVTDRSGNSKESSLSLDVQQFSIKQKRFEQKDDKRIERFSLIVFDFNKADLNADNKRIAAEVKSRIRPNSTVTIAGYADKSGDSDYNKELARRRCMEVERIISSDGIVPVVNPIGSDVLLYDNSTPEGRAYCRTVQIVIETPVK